MTEIRVLIVGTGGMANAHAEAYAAMEGAMVVAGVDTDPVRLAAFLEKHGIERGFESVADAISWGQFDAVSNVTPDAVHHRTTLPLIAAGKHVLCEKPLATNAADAREMAEIAHRAGVVNMVNLTYRNGAALVAAQRLVADGEIGEVRHFEASYLQSWLTQPSWGDWRTQEQWLWRLSKAHGSMGVLGDVGVHILDFATFVAGADVADISCRLTTFDKASGGRIGAYTLDANDSMNMHVRLENGAAGVVHASRVATGHLNDLSLKIFGTKGALDVKFSNNQSLLNTCLGGNILTGTWARVELDEIPTNFERFIDAVRSGKQVAPDFARGAALQSVLDTAIRSDAQASTNLKV